MGWLSLGSLKRSDGRELAFRVNVSLVLGALAFGLFHFAPGAWIAFLVTVLAHELGHAAFVRLTGHRVVGVDVHGLGGTCQWNGRTTPLERAAIAWGGVVAQLLLFGVALGLQTFVGRPDSPLLAQLLSALIWQNLAVAGVNLLPFRWFDGREAWRLPGALLRRGRAARRIRPALLGVPNNRITEDVLDRACEIVEREAEEARLQRTAKS
jgi:hypothetical protein